MADLRQDTAWQAAGLANTYLDGVRGAIPLASVQLDIMVRLATAAQPAADSLLDLGCGDGILGHALLDAYGGNVATAVFADFSPRMLEAARGRLRNHDAQFLEIDYAQPDWVELAGNALPTTANGFDVIVSGFSIHHQPDKRKREIYAEIYSLLSPGGIFLNLEHVASASRWAEKQFDEYFIEALYRHHAPSGKTRDELAAEYYHRPDKSANILAPVELQCDWLRGIGFGNVDCYFKVFELALFGGIKPPAP